MFYSYQLRDTLLCFIYDTIGFTQPVHHWQALQTNYTGYFTSILCSQLIFFIPQPVRIVLEK